MSKENFLNHMKALLGEEYAAFEATLGEPAFRGVYVNRLKCDTATFQTLFPYALAPTPFSPNGFYIAPTVEGLGTHPLHHAGAFYAQEPSAMSAAAVLDVEPGDKVLDLCAAPGGKTTALAGKLGGSGLLWSNEYVKQRTFTLLSNVERIGARGVVISNSDTKTLAKALPAFFDKILVDAPCSGEGMLRREKAEYERWNEKNIAICAARQTDILEDAAILLAPGGSLVYSTCTFNKEENEGVVTRFLETHSDFSLVPIDHAFGSPGMDMPEAKRIFPKDGGEGHFVAKLHKAGEKQTVKQNAFTAEKAPDAFYEFYREQFYTAPYGTPGVIGGKVYLLPPQMPAAKGVHILRAGVLAGEMKGKLFFPAHQLYSAAHTGDCRKTVNFALSDPRLYAYLHGEETDVSELTHEKGFHAVAVEGIPLGFGKVSGGKMKNHYPKGLRNVK